MRTRPFIYNIDVVGTCNLRCPSCPIGNISAHSMPKGAMPVEMLRDIIKKAKKEAKWISVHLYNWTEPLLHPKIGDCIRAVSDQGAPARISTNLNLDKRIDEVADARPDSVRISLSGFKQSTYGVTHERGNIEVVKENMEKLANSVRRNGKRTDLTVLFHRYLHNHDDEVQMKSFAEKTGYRFEPVWAFLMPLEKNIDFAEGKPLSNADQTIIDQFALPVDRAIQVARNTDMPDCKLRSDQFAIGPDGNVSVCCATYEQPTIGNYLDKSFAELQTLKTKQSICTTCMSHGLHVLSVYGAPDELDRIAVERVREEYPDYDPPNTSATKRYQDLVRQGLHRLRRVAFG